MKVQVLFFANIKQVVGSGELVVEIGFKEQCSFRELLFEINRLIDPQLCGYEESRDSSSIPIRAAVNGVLIHAIRQTTRTIEDGDSVTIFPLFSAG